MKRWYYIVFLAGSDRTLEYGNYVAWTERDSDRPTKKNLADWITMIGEDHPGKNVVILNIMPIDDDKNEVKQ